MRLSRCLLLFLISFCLIQQAISQTIPGEWRAYPAFHNATKSVKAFSRIYVLSDGGLYSYTPEDNSIQTYDKVNTLSDNQIADIAYSAKERAIVIGYLNGNIDLLYENDDIYNITDLLNSALPDKRINEVKVADNTTYISTNSGIVLLNISKKEISATYRFNGNVSSTILYDKELFCCTTTGIYKGNLSENLLDPSKWTRIESRGIFLRLFPFADRIVVSVNDRGLFFIDLNGRLERIDKGVEHVCVNDGKLFVYKQDTLYIYTSKDAVNKYYAGSVAKNVLVDAGNLWISCGKEGLQKYQIKDDRLVITKPLIIPESPVRNYFNFMNMSSSGKLLVAGGSLNYSGVDYEGTLMSFQDNKWFNFPDDGIENQTGLKYINLTSIVEDPSEPGHYFAGSARHGLYEYRNSQFVKLYTFDNSPLKTILPDNPKPYEFVSVDGLQYDDKGNLWMLNNEVDTIFRIIKSDGSWTSLYYPEIAGLPTFKYILFDSNGLIWTASTRYKPGIFCTDIKGTFEDQSDDAHSFSGASFTNQDGVSVVVNDIFFITEDYSGIMWIGTDQGIFTLDNPKSFVSEDKHIFKRVKIPRNDGTNQADYLLSGIYTTAICIDHGNRKWIGTMNKGIFLVDKDGINTIHHFTKDNSPLISDNILDIEINGATGEVYIATDEGLVVFGGDAFRPEENLDKSNVTVFPNPVAPELDGNITVKGLTQDCTVKILNTAGRIVYDGTSQGGGFTWNCGNGKKRVPSGVYFIMAVNSDGSSGIVSRVTIIR